MHTHDYKTHVSFFVGDREDKEMICRRLHKWLGCYALAICIDIHESKNSALVYYGRV